MTNEERWDDMTYIERWHDPAYRLQACERGLQRKAGDGHFAPTNHASNPEVAHCTHGFSSIACELCGSPLGGNRICVTRIHPKDETLYYAVCIDCQYFVEYGTLDDQTMLEIEDNNAEAPA